jgi:hypothetical protein
MAESAKQVSSRLSLAEKRRRRGLAMLEDIAWLVECGGTWDSIPSRVGLARPQSLYKLLWRHERRDLIEALDARKNPVWVGRRA